MLEAAAKAISERLQSHSARKLLYQQLRAGWISLSTAGECAESTAKRGKAAKAKNLSTAGECADSRAAMKMTRAEFESLHGKYNEPDACPTWSELWLLEGLMLRILPIAELRASVQLLRDEYKRMATGDSVIAFERKYGAGPMSSKMKVDEERASAYALLQEVQQLRVGRSTMEWIRFWQVLSTLGMVVGFLTWWGSDIAGGVSGVTDKLATGPMLLVLAVAAGMLGGFLSIMLRLYSIPITGDLADRAPDQWRRLLWFLSPFLSVAQAVVGAIVMLFVLQSGVLQQLNFPIFPKFINVVSKNMPQSKDRLPTGTPTTAPTLQAPTTAPSLQPQKSVLADDNNFYWTELSAPQSSADIGKMIILCFIAGFFERLVPDTLGQLAEGLSRKQERKP